jgi:hypothetical protein
MSTLSLHDWGNIGQVVAALAAIFGLGLILLQLRATDRHSRAQATSDYLTRFNERDFGLGASRAIRFLETKDAREQTWKRAFWSSARHADSSTLPVGGYLDLARDRPMASKNDVYNTLAFFEDLGGAFNTGRLDRRHVLRLFRGLSQQYYDAFEWLAPELSAVYVEPASKIPWRGRFGLYHRWRRSSRILEEWGIMNRRLQQMSTNERR